jgi:hypothetical protein
VRLKPTTGKIRAVSLLIFEPFGFNSSLSRLGLRPLVAEPDPEFLDDGFKVLEFHEAASETFF